MDISDWFRLPENPIFYVVPETSLFQNEWFIFLFIILFSSILEIDFAVGEIMEKLEKIEMDDDTLIYFTSDHGSHIDLGTDGGSNGNFKGTYVLYKVISFITLYWIGIFS